MNRITPIEANLPHEVSKVICLSCYYRWVSVYPEDTPLEKLECPSCLATGFVIKTGETLPKL